MENKLFKAILIITLMFGITVGFIIGYDKTYIVRQYNTNTTVSVVSGETGEMLADESVYIGDNDD